jgi:anti-sigma-K factor RskA
MSAADHQRFEEDIGAFLLGALANGEHEQFERHLAGCHVCQDELERLKGAADALPRSVEQYEPPTSLKIALMEQVYAEAAPERAPRRRPLAERLGLGRLARLSPQVAVVATALVLVVGVLAGYGISALTGDDGSRSIVASVDKARVGDGRATLVVPEDGSSGAQLRVSSMPQPQPGRVYEIWYQRGRQVEPGPLFSVDRNGNGVGAVPGDLAGVTAVLVTREQAGGARQPSEPPVIHVKIRRA